MGKEQQQLWDKQEDEPPIWFRRFERYRLMEPVRSIVAVFQQEETKKNREKPRKKPTGDWYEIAKKWKWEERVAAWDAYVDEEVEKRIVAERKKVLRSHYALMHKRVELLDRKVQQLAEITDDEGKVWLPDVKSVGSGPSARRVDLVQFNDAAFRELREYLDDIAAEMGERVKTTKQEVSGSLDIEGAKNSLLAKLSSFTQVDQVNDAKTKDTPS